MSITFAHRVHYYYGLPEVLVRLPITLLFPTKSESSNRLVSDLFAAKEGNDNAILKAIDFREAQVKTSCLNVMRDLNFEPKAVILKFITL